MSVTVLAMSVVPAVVGHIDPWHVWRHEAATVPTLTAEGTLYVFPEVIGKWPDCFELTAMLQ